MKFTLKTLLLSVTVVALGCVVVYYLRPDPTLLLGCLIGIPINAAALAAALYITGEEITTGTIGKCLAVVSAGSIVILVQPSSVIPDFLPIITTSYVLVFVVPPLVWIGGLIVI